MLRRNGMNGLIGTVLLVALVGCSARPVHVDCDGKLRPINAPAPIAKATGTNAVTQAASGAKSSTQPKAGGP
jgi:hypothetical protein